MARQPSSPVTRGDHAGADAVNEVLQFARQLVAVIAIQLAGLQLAAEQFVLQAGPRGRGQPVRVEAVKPQLLGWLDQRRDGGERNRPKRTLPAPRRAAVAAAAG